MIVLMAGLPGTGKTMLAHEAARRIGGVAIRKDAIRDALFPERLVEYSAEQDETGNAARVCTIGHCLPHAAGPLFRVL